jgi:hypothetical protein
MLLLLLLSQAQPVAPVTPVGYVEAATVSATLIEAGV